MHFSKAEKVLHDNNNFNPPPGYYNGSEVFSSFINRDIKPANNQSFTRQQRFDSNKRNDQQYEPGPGTYFNDRTTKIKKRMLEDVKKKENSVLANNFQKFQGESQIKISSIPSIPKKSATRVYEELAPGILILHEQENQGANIGPGSYEVKDNLLQKKPISYKINPEHKKKKKNQEIQPEVIIPKIADEIREEKRLLYKKKLFKSSGINKSMISPSDLCLQVIILRQKLLRTDENPPPGYYYNQKFQSSFKDADPDMLPQYQLLMGKEQRFKQKYDSQLGPGQYYIQQQKKKQGGYILKQQRKLHENTKFAPGPGFYKISKAKQEPIDAKGSYPPIFGSGCNRFYSADVQNSTTPGPGSYKLDIPKKKKQKYVKVKKNFYESQTMKDDILRQGQQDLISMGGDRGRSTQNYYRHKSKNQKNSHVFNSKVERFSSKKNVGEVGPGMYEISSKQMGKQTFNKNKNGYIGQRGTRFDDSKIRPNIGPGTYEKI